MHDAPTPPDALPPRYREVSLLGAGAFGQVYRAIDPEGRPAAVKVLAPALAGQPAAAWQFASEHRRLARLAHPAFPRALEEGRTPDGRPFYAMALVEGAPPTPGMPATRVREVLLAIADALAYLHGVGLVHGDLKPENLRLDADGRVWLLDVGLMSPVGARREAIAGTLEYLAPEVLRKAPVAPASDLYALGALGHELWTGRAPFTGTPAELIRAQLQAPVPPVSVPAPDPELEALLQRLMAKDPADRPHAHAVRQALGLDVDPALLATAGAGLRVGAFVGREASLAAWRDTIAVRSGWLLARGAFGTGKSRWLEECRLEAQLAGWAWVGATCSGDAPAAPLRALVAQALAQAGLAPGGPVAAWLDGRVPDDLAALEPPARQVAIGAALASALSAAANALGGLALGLDDLHLADTATRDMIALLARVPGDAPVAWALAGEPTEAAWPGQAVSLAPLTPDETRALVDARLGTPSPSALLADLTAASQGVPLVLDLLLEHLVASGALRPSPAGWTYDAAARAQGQAPSDTLKALWAHRLATLTPPARDLAAWVALADGLSAAWVLEAAEAEAPVLEALMAAGLVSDALGRLRVTVPGLRAHLLDAMPAPTRQARAGRLARRVLAEAPPEALPTGDLTRAARLAVEADDSSLAWPLCAEAGHRHLALAAPREAQAFLLEAAGRLDAAVPAPAQLAVYFPLAEAERLLDQLEPASGHYERALALAHAPGDAPTAARAWVGLAKCRQLRGDYPGALAALADAEIVAERAGDRAQQARALAAEARLRAFRGEPALGMARCEAAASLAREADAPAVLAQALNLLGYLVIHADLHRAEAAIAMLDEAIALTTAIGDRVGLGSALDNLGNAHLALGDLAAAAEAFARYAENCQAIGAETELIAAQLNQAIVAAERGEVESALRLGRRVAERAAQAGRKFLVGAAKAAIGQALWRGGRPDEAATALDEALALARDIDNRLLEEHVRVYRLEALLASQDLEAAAAEAEIACALNATSGNAEMAERLAVLRGDLARQQGLADTARAHLTPVLDSPNRLAAHRAHQLLAMLAVAAGDHAAARPHAEAALSIAEAWDTPWHREADLRLLAEATGRPIDSAASASSRPSLSAHDLLAHMEDLAAAEDEAAISRAALAGAMAMARAERGYVLSYEGGRLRRAVTSGLDYDAELAEGFSQSIVEQVLFSQSPLYVTDASADAAWSQARSVMALELKTVIALPLGTPACILGVLYMDRQAIDPVLTASDLALLHAFATAAGSAIVRERARAEQELSAAIAAGLGAQLSRQLPPDAAGREVLTAAIAAAGAERGFWLLPAGREWRPVLGLDGEGREVPYGDVSRGVIEAVSGTGEPVGILDLSAAEGWQARASIQALGLRTVWCLPAGTPDGALLYLDTTAMATADPAQSLPGLEALLRHAGPLLA